jgi:formylglycine-generating enzyme required for sulfatase activity
MATKVFISYRREDSRYQAHRIHAAFCKALPSDHVFMDVDSIAPGANFRKILKDWVDQCEVLLALVGPGWIDARDPKTEMRRLDSKSDFVRIEIGEALARGIPVVPVILDGAPMPDVDLLPDDLKELADRQAVFVEFRTFDADVERLIRKLKLGQGAGGAGSPQQPTSPPVHASPSDRYRAEGRIKVDAAIVHGAPDGWFLPGNGKVEWFQDYEGGPEMVIVPAGRFMMGSPESEPPDGERPQHPVTIAQPFGIGRHAVTRGQFAAFANNTGHSAEGGARVWKGSEWTYDTRASWRDPGFAQNDSHPVVCVSWQDAKAFAAWLSNQSGRAYRLLTEAEWEYAARAGSTTPFWWGSTITSAQANYDGNYVYGKSGAKGEFRRQTVAVGSFAANQWGLYQVHGNVWEWCQDVWHSDYNGAPADGSAWLEGGDPDDRVVRGGCWGSAPENLRSAFRETVVDQTAVLGFRVGRTLLSP